MIESNIILEVTYGEGEIQLLINLKFSVIVAEPGSPIRNPLHSTSFLLCETIITYSQYKTETSIGNY